MTLWDFKYKNNVKRIWYAARINMSDTKRLSANHWNAYCFANKKERDNWVDTNMKDPDFFAVKTDWWHVRRIIGFSSESYCVAVVGNHNQLSCVEL